METPENTNQNARPDPDEIKDLLEEDKAPPAAAPAEEPPDSEDTKAGRGLNFLYDVPLEVSVEVGRSKILLRDLLRMGEGFVIELDKVAGDPLDLYVNNRLVARGEAVMVGERFGIRLTDVVSASDRVENLGKK